MITRLLVPYQHISRSFRTVVIRSKKRFMYMTFFTTPLFLAFGMIYLIRKLPNEYKGPMSISEYEAYLDQQSADVEPEEISD